MTLLVPIQLDKSTGRLYAKSTSSGGTFGMLGFVHNQTTPSTTWTIVHNANTQNLLVQVYDNTNQAILPDEIFIIDGTTVQVTFGIAFAGTANVALFVST